VRRTLKRSPADFMFELTRSEMASLRPQFASLKRGPKIRDRRQGSGAKNRKDEIL